MGIVGSTIRVYRRGGLPAVVRSARIRLARAVYPGDLPSPRRRRGGGPARAASHRATTPARPVQGQAIAAVVEHAEAVAFFERRRGTYEQLVGSVETHIDPDGVILDVGANIGYFSKVVGERTDFRGTAHLYEPIPHLAAMCDQTLADAPFTTVVHPYALAEEDGEATLHLAHDGNLGWNTLVSAKAQSSTELTISLRRFDPDALDRPPSFIKVDVEGAEHRVLSGMLEALAAWAPRPVILCEIGWGAGHPEWTAELAVFDAVVELGYEVRTLEGDPLDLRELTRTTDVLFVPTTAARPTGPVPGASSA